MVLNGKGVRIGNIYNYRNDYDKIVDNISEISNYDSYQIVIVVNDYKTAIEIGKLVEELDDVYISNASPNYYNKIDDGKHYFLDITNIGCNKGSAIEFMQNYMNTESDYSLCFGDHMNDIEMFKKCKYKVAMSNANDKVKEYSNYTTLSNEEDGVTYFLDKYINN